ncbi:MAG: ATP-binding cassette domain-containing protein [Chromatiaceae bacterium]|nr:ATP-binding cassette domain-containing protein [Chromatiaceae bacterium]
MAELRLDALQHPLLGVITLSIAPGERVFLSGPSGAGKSLLLRAIADLDPHRGEVWLGDEARSRMSAHRWRRRLGLLPAEPAWWADRVGEHLPPASEAAPLGLENMLARLGFEPEALDWTVARLSTGERQRLALVRLLAQAPEALLLDEPTANLDPRNRAQVEALIEDYRAARHCPLLWVSHDAEQRARLGGRRFVINAERLEPEEP